MSFRHIEAQEKVAFSQLINFMLFLFVLFYVSLRRNSREEKNQQIRSDQLGDHHDFC